MIYRHLLRFMSITEAAALLDGQTLKNETDHYASATDSVGFCFAPLEEVTDTAIYNQARHLSGIVDMQLCLVAEIHGGIPAKFKKGYGIYSAGRLDEYSIKRYSLRDFDHWTIYRPDPKDKSPIIWSGSWLKPELVDTKESAEAKGLL